MSEYVYYSIKPTSELQKEIDQLSANLASMNDVTANLGTLRDMLAIAEAGYVIESAAAVDGAVDAVGNGDERIGILRDRCDDFAVGVSAVFVLEEENLRDGIEHRSRFVVGRRVGIPVPAAA